MTVGQRMQLTPLKRDLIVSAIRAGNYFETAVQYAGVAKATAYKWLSQGRELREELEAQVGKSVEVDRAVHEAKVAGEGEAEDTLAHIRGIGESHPRWACVELLDAVERAKAAAEVRAVAQITKAGETHWQANAWYLERTNYEKWGRKDRVQITGANDGPIQTQSVSMEDMLRKLTPEERATMLAAQRIMQRASYAGTAVEPEANADEGSELV